MINTVNLNDKAVKKGFVPLANDTYTVTVTSIAPWKETVKDIMVNMRDEKGRIMKDSNGAIIRSLEKDVKFYTADVVLTIKGGDFDGRKIFTNLTTHPNTKFVTTNFLRALGVEDTTYADIPTVCVGKDLRVETMARSYDKVTVDPDTGLDSVITKTATDVKNFLPLANND